MHRNLKPENILVSEYGRIRISDFTSSKITCIKSHGRNTEDEPNENQRSERQSKRLWYKPPEMLFRTAEYGQECDMWQIGCLFIEIILQGKPIFASNSEI